MVLRWFSLLVFSGLASCSLPDTPLWNDREMMTSARMPPELITKVVVHGSAKSIVSNPVTSTHKGISMWWQRSRLLGDSILKQRALLNTAYADGKDIEHALDLIGLPTPLPGKIDYLVDGKEFFDALYHSVNQAESRIDTQVFIFDNDDVATRYANRLKERSQDVRCRVMMDRLGSISSWWTAPETPLPKGFDPPSSMPHYLQEGSAVKVRLSQNPWLISDHSKLIMIDGKEAYLGGMNIGREYRHDWHDFMVRVTGPITTELQNHFDRSWRIQGLWGDWGLPFYRKLKPNLDSHDSTHFPIRLLHTAPNRFEIEQAILVAIRMSRKRIYLQNSYVTSEVILQELLAACDRGVEVNFVFPVENDSKIMDSANRRFGAKLLERGGKVYAYPKFSHVKAVIVDDWACIGSANLDGLSMRINGELNIAYSNTKAVEALRLRIFEKDIRASRRLKRGDLKIAPFSLNAPISQQL
jgi:cardiolipin synthase